MIRNRPLEADSSCAVRSPQCQHSRAVVDSAILMSAVCRTWSSSQEPTTSADCLVCSQCAWGSSSCRSVPSTSAQALCTVRRLRIVACVGVFSSNQTSEYGAILTSVFLFSRDVLFGMYWPPFDRRRLLIRYARRCSCSSCPVRRKSTKRWLASDASKRGRHEAPQQMERLRMTLPSQRTPRALIRRHSKTGTIDHENHS